MKKYINITLLSLFFTFYSLMGSNAENSTKIPVLHSHSFGGSKIRFLHYTKGYEKLISFFYQNKDIQQPENYIFDRDIHKIITFNYTDVQIDMGIYGSIPNIIQTQLGQEADINILYSNLEKITDPLIIGFGVSRGAATWLTMLGTKDISKKISVIILESPFASMKNVSMYNMLRYCVECVHTIIPSLDPRQTSDLLFTTLFRNHNVLGIQPIDVVEFIPKDIPIMLVHSREDGIIPINHSRELYIKLRETGHDLAYLVEIEQGAHAAVLWGKKGNIYRNVVHALYRQYGLPYNSLLAGNIDISVFQPSIEVVQARIIATLPSINPVKNENDLGNLYSSTFNIFM